MSILADLLTLDSLVALLTLTVLEIVLGIDNIVFIAIVAARLPESQRDKARVVGLSLAIITRLMLLGTLSWLASLTSPLFTAFNHGVSLRDLILISGGLFLIWKATKEIHAKSSGSHEDAPVAKPISFVGVVTQFF